MMRKLLLLLLLLTQGALGSTLQPLATTSEDRSIYGCHGQVDIGDGQVQELLIIRGATEFRKRYQPGYLYYPAQLRAQEKDDVVIISGQNRKVIQVEFDQNAREIFRPGKSRELNFIPLKRDGKTDFPYNYQDFEVPAKTFFTANTSGFAFALYQQDDSSIVGKLISTGTLTPYTAIYYNDAGKIFFEFDQLECYYDQEVVHQLAQTLIDQYLIF